MSETPIDVDPSPTTDINSTTTNEIYQHLTAAEILDATPVVGDSVRPNIQETGNWTHVEDHKGVEYRAFLVGTKCIQPLVDNRFLIIRQRTVVVIHHNLTVFENYCYTEQEIQWPKYTRLALYRNTKPEPYPISLILTSINGVICIIPGVAVHKIAIQDFPEYQVPDSLCTTTHPIDAAIHLQEDSAPNSAFMRKLYGAHKSLKIKPTNKTPQEDNDNPNSISDSEMAIQTTQNQLAALQARNKTDSPFTPNLTPFKRRQQLETLRKAEQSKKKTTEPTESKNQEETTTNKPSTKKPPPIFVNATINDFATFRTTLLKNYKQGEIKLQSQPNGFKILCTTAEQHTTAMTYLKTNQVPAFTYQKPEEKSTTYIIKGIPKEVPTDDIQEEIEDMGYKIELIERVKVQNREISTIKIRLKPNPKNSTFIKTTALSYYIVTVEHPYFQGYAICNKCLEYGHTSKRCTAKPQCTQCPGNHHYLDCPDDETEPDWQPYCQRCKKKGHRATYRGCPEYQRYEDSRITNLERAPPAALARLQQKQDTARQEAADKIKRAELQTGVSYSQRMGGKQTSEPPQHPNQTRDRSRSRARSSSRPRNPATENNTMQHQSEDIRTLVKMNKDLMEQIAGLMNTVNNLVSLVTSLLAKP